MFFLLAFAPSLSLSWEAPPRCPSGSEVEAEVKSLLGAPSGRLLGQALVARAQVAERGGRWRVKIETALDGVAGERSLDGDSCAAVASAAALILAMTLDPEAVRGAPPTPARPPPAPPPVLEATAEVVEVAPVRVSLRPSMLVGVGALPRATAGAAVALATRRGRGTVELSAQYWRDQRAPAIERGGAGGDFGMIAASVAGCYAVVPGGLELAGCAGLEVDRVSARGYGVADPGSGTGTWLAPIAGMAITWTLTRRVALRLDLQAAAPLARPRFVLLGVGPVWQPPAANGRAGMGVLVAF